MSDLTGHTGQTENLSKLQRLMQLYSALVDDRSFYSDAWVLLARQFRPTKSRHLESKDIEANKLHIRTEIPDGTGNLAMRALMGGMHGGMTSPMRPWFRLTLADEKLAKRRRVRDWLDNTEKRITGLFSRSNFYQAIGSIYGELGCFGTAFMYEHPIMTPGRGFGLRFDPLTAGEFVIATDANSRVDTVGRRMEMTPVQMAETFGLEKCSDVVKRAYSMPAQAMTSRYGVIHLVKPRTARKYGKADSANKRWGSYYWEEAHSGRNHESELLSESGYDEFPGFGPRWDVTAQDTYGTSPAMDVLGDSQQLQSYAYTTAVASEKMADPPVAVPSSVKHPDTLPGGINFVDGAGPGNQIYPIYNLRPDLSGMNLEKEQLRAQIRQGLFYDLFLMISRANRTMTATEVVERQEEKLIMLGPVLERLHYELFLPLIDLTFYQMLRHDYVDPWPEEIRMVPIKVDFVSLLAQALKLANVDAVNQLMGFVGQFAPVIPEYLDAVDYDESIDFYAESLGTPARILAAREVREKRRKERAAAIQAREAQEQMAAGAQAANQLANAPTEGGAGSVLDNVIGGWQ